MAPNPIDFDKVFAEMGRLGETGNFVVLSTICVMLGLYVVGVVLASREDRKDKMKVNPSLSHLILFYAMLTIPYLDVLCERRNQTCRTILYHTIPAISYHTIPYHTISYHTIPYHTIPYHAKLQYPSKCYLV